jgi:hypothetical protein
VLCRGRGKIAPLELLVKRRKATLTGTPLSE